MEEDIKKIISDIKSFQEEQKVKHSDNEDKMKQNNLKIEDIKKEIQQNKSMQKSFKEEEYEYKELSDKIEELQKGMKDLETENIYLNNENMRIRSGKTNKEKEKEIETRKQELKGQINQSRRFLIKNRNMSKEEISNKINEIQEQQKFLKSDIEAGKRGIEIEKKVVEQTGYQDALEFKKKMLANREEDYANNKTKVQEYMNLLGIEDVFEEINRLDLEMNEIDKISIENINIDMNVFRNKQEDEKYIQDWDEAIKENERRDQESKYIQDWDEAIKENKKRDQEAKYIQDWDEAIKENERRDKETKYIQDWDEAIKENERKDKEKEIKNDAKGLGAKLREKNRAHDNPSNRGKKNKITKICISESRDKVSIMKDGKNQDIPYSLGFLINSGKESLKSKTYKDISKDIAGSTLKGWLLRRKINPVIFEVLKDNATPKAIEKYIEAIQNEQELDFSLVHDLANTQLKGKEKRIMRRAARAEQKLDDENVCVNGLEDSKTKLLNRGKQKLKNAPKTIGKAAKFTAKYIGKAVPTIGRKINDARKQFAKKLHVKVNAGPTKAYNNDIEHEEIDAIIDKDGNEIIDKKNDDWIEL